VSSQVAKISTNVWLSARRKFISLHSLQNIVGFEVGRCYGAGMIKKRVFTDFPWPDVNFGEDHSQYCAVRQNSVLSTLMIETDDLLYVHRRHETNVSARHRTHLWQGVLPLQLAGSEAVEAAALVTNLLAQPYPDFLQDVQVPSKML